MHNRGIWGGVEKMAKAKSLDNRLKGLFGWIKSDDLCLMRTDGAKLCQTNVMKKSYRVGDAVHMIIPKQENLIGFKERVAECVGKSGYKCHEVSLLATYVYFSFPDDRLGFVQARECSRLQG
jgi:hypothetical protein